MRATYEEGCTAFTQRHGSVGASPDV